MSKGSNKLTLAGAAFTSMGSGLGVALVGLIGYVFAAAGKASPLILLIGLVCGYFSCAPWFMLSKKVALRGGQYSVVVENLGPIAAAVSTYAAIPGALYFATYPLSIATYVTSVAPGLVPYTKWVAIAIAVVVCIILCKNIKVYEKFQNVLTICLIAALMVFTVLGFGHIIKNGVNIFDWSNDPFWTKNGLMGGLTALPVVMGTMYGYTWIIHYGSAVEKPTKNIPKAILIGGVAISFFWLALGIVGVNVLPVEQVAGQPLTVVASALMPQWAVVAFVILGPTFTILTSYIGLIQGPVAQLAQAASEGWLPKIIAKRNAEGRCIALYIGVTAVVVITVLTGVSAASVATFTTLIGQIGTLLVNFAFFNMPNKHPEVFKDKKDIVAFQAASVGGMIMSLLSAYLALRSISLTLAGSNVAILAVMTAFGYWWYKKGKVNIQNNFEIDAGE